MSECKRITCCQTDLTGLGPEQPAQGGCRQITCCQPYAYTYTGAATYTATCPEGETGDPVTVTASATSTVSQEQANADALALATEQAEAALVCTPDPSGCCMYSASDYDDLYPNDLPEALMVGGVTLTWDGTGWTDGSTTLAYYSTPDGPEYQLYIDGIVGYRSDCLIGEYTAIDGVGGVTVEDQFEDQYLVDFDVFSDVVNRTELCLWDLPGTCQLMFDSDLQKWTLSFTGGQGLFIKTGNQNTPVGTYSNGLDPDLTVSA